MYDVGIKRVVLTGSSLTEATALATKSAHIAQMLTVPVLMDFKGKTVGKTFDVPHVAKTRNAATFDAPTTFGTEFSSFNYGQISSQDGAVTSGVSYKTAGGYAQTLFSFDLLTDLKNRGIIPKWWGVNELNAAIKSITVTWVGYGVGANAGSPTNGASLRLWAPVITNWANANTNTASAPSAILWIPGTPANYIDSNGFLHVLAHSTYPSDGVIASIIYTDYVKVEVVLNAEYLLTPVVEAMGRPGNVAPGRAVQVGGLGASGNLAVPRVVAPADGMPATHEGIVAAAVMMGSNGASRDVVRVVGKTIFFDGALTANTDTLVSNPAAGKKFRLLGYVISWNVSQNATIIVKDGTSGTIQKHGAPTGVGGMAVLLPPNGYLSATANNGLYLKADQNVGNVTIRAYVTEE